MTLTFLIPTLNEPFYIRRLSRLMDRLKPQLGSFGDLYVDYSINDAGRSMSIGTKRNLMLGSCASDYFSFIDSDDLVSENFVEEIGIALMSQPDVVTMQGTMTTDGKDKRSWTIKLGSDYTEKNGHYYRWPNHLAIMRNRLVRHVKFPDVKSGEDFEWSKKIHSLGLLKTEVHIPRQIYHYDYISPKFRS